MSRRKKSRRPRAGRGRAFDGERELGRPLDGRERDRVTNIERELDRALDHHRAGQLAEAEEGYRRVLARQPEHPNALNLLGLLALDTGHVGDAIELASSAVRAAPDVGMFHANLGTALMAGQRGAEAEKALRAAMALGHAAFQAPFNLGLLLIEQSRKDEALAALQQAAAIDPQNRDAAFLIAALSGQHRDEAPSSYVASLFDSYAPSFESHVTGALAYRVPHELRALFARQAGVATPAALRIVDLGCGTGLCGVAFRDLAAHLAGCDLSPRMVAAASERGLYDELVVADLVSFLAGRSNIDLIVAADVFIYVGALDQAMRAMASALDPGGHVAFSVETAAGEHFVLRPSGRFAHSPRYLEVLAGQHGFVMVESEPAVIRQEAHQPIAGHLHLWQKRAGAAASPWPGLGRASASSN